MARSTGKLRIFINSRYRLICLDAATGTPVSTFGEKGVVDLSQGLIWPIDRTHYTNTSPPVVYKDLIILGNGVGDRLVYKNDPPGDIRAFHARTGKQVWSFHTIPQRGEPGHETWQEGSTRVTGHTNAWAPMTLDLERGLLYAPVGTPSNDFYGGTRKGAGLYGESIVCLDAATGRAEVALPDRTPRHLGLRPPVASEPGHDHRQRQAHRRGRATDQAGLCLRLRSRHGHACVAHRGAQSGRRAMCQARKPGPRSRFPPRRRRSASRA